MLYLSLCCQPINPVYQSGVERKFTASAPVELLALLGGSGGDVDDVLDLLSSEFLLADKFKMDQVDNLVPLCIGRIIFT